MEEEWKPIVGYEGIYEVSYLGQVRRVVSPAFPEPRPQWSSWHYSPITHKLFEKPVICCGTAWTASLFHQPNRPANTVNTSVSVSSPVDIRGRRTPPQGGHYSHCSPTERKA